MGLLRFLIRALFPRRKNRALVRPMSPPARPRHPSQPTPRPQEILIVETREIIGRCWVIDGDTIDIAGTRIRLAGIDAPELDHPFGQAAKYALMRLCKGAVIRAVTEGEVSHGRAVATCYLPDGTDLAAEMVRAGLAIDWKKFSGGRYRSLEPPDIRRKLWRCDARQKGRMPVTLPD